MEDTLYEAQVGKALVRISISNNPDEQMRDLSDALGLLVQMHRAVDERMRGAEAEIKPCTWFVQDGEH